MKIRKDDTVVVISGKDKGKIGKVLSVDPVKMTVKVAKVNVQTKHKKRTQKEPAEIKHIEGSIHISNVMYYDETVKKGVRVGFKSEDNKKLRVAKKTGEVIK